MNVPEAINKLKKMGYTFVRVSNNKHIIGKYDYSSRYAGNNYNQLLTKIGYGNYSFAPKNFTLNFVHTQKKVSESKSIDEVIKYVDEINKKIELAPKFTSTSKSFTRSFKVDLASGKIIGANNILLGTVDTSKLKFNSDGKIDPDSIRLTPGKLPDWTIDTTDTFESNS